MSICIHAATYICDVYCVIDMCTCSYMFVCYVDTMFILCCLRCVHVAMCVCYVHSMSILCYLSSTKLATYMYVAVYLSICMF